MNSFTIAQLSQFSGIKPHTLRMWEQRYQVLSPSRSSGNTRIYNNADLKRLLNIVSLTDSGHKVAELCRMPDEALGRLIKDQYDLEKEDFGNYFVFQLLAAGMTFDESSFQKTLSHCLLRFGMDVTYKNIIYPLLNRVGLLWATDMLPPAHEHFMCNLIRQKLHTAIDSLPSPRKDSSRWLLFLPEDEYHETGLLFAQYVLRKNAINAYYLGSSVPLPTLELAVGSINPDFVLLFFVHRNLPENIHAYLKEVRKSFREGRIYVCGNENVLGQVDLPQEVKWLRSIEELERELN